MNAQERKTDVMRTLAEMVVEVLGEDDLDIRDETSFRDELGFESIQFIALADMIQTKYADVNFAMWLQGKEVAAIGELRVGEVADFVVASTAD
jgi:acyl carrier protein